MGKNNYENWEELKKAGKGLLTSLANNSGSQSGSSVTPTAPTAPTKSPYNSTTNYDNELAYLTNLSKNGNEGEQAWAKNQLSILNDAMAQTITTSDTVDVYSPNGTYNDADLPADAKAQIEAAQEMYGEAMAKGDTESANWAHRIAEGVRALFGYSGGEDGSEKIELGSGLSSSDILSWLDNYNTANPAPTYEEPTVNGSTYSEETERLLGEILNREDFSYNAETDPLYAQYKTMYNREGDRAMRDTLAEAAASAGGMNSYAITAAQQANNYYASQLNDKIPELYQLAYEMYLQDKESKVQDLGLLSQLDETQYSRYRDTMSDYKDDKNFAYGVYTDAVSQGNIERDFATSDQATAKNEVWNLISLGVTPSADLIAKSGMSQEDINLAVAAVKAGGGIDNNNNNNNNNGYTPKGDNDNEDDTPIVNNNTSSPSGVSDEIKNKCASFTSNTALADYLDGLEASGAIEPEDSDKLYAQYADHNEKYIVNEDGAVSNTHSYSDMVKSTQGWEVLDNGGGNLLGIDKNAIVRAPNGEEMTLNQLREKLKSENMTQAEANEAIKALQQNLGISSNWLFGW